MLEYTYNRMEEASLDPLVAFSWLASELLGRAVSACMQAHSAPASVNPAYRKVTLELAQSQRRQQQIMLKVSDEGHGLLDTHKTIQHVFASLERPLASSCVVQDPGLLLRTTNLSENTIRRYYISSSSSRTTDFISTSTTQQTSRKKLEVVKVPLEEEKVPGMQLSGTQATLLFSSLAVPPDAALAACQQLLSMLSTLCPPVHLVLKAQNLPLVDEANGDNLVLQSQQQQQEQQGDYPHAGSASPTAITIDIATLPTRTLTTFARHLEPLPATYLLTPMQRLKAGLLEGFPSSASTPMPLSSSQPPSLSLLSPAPLPLLSFVGVGEGAVPRGCKWTACAGVVLQLPDHDAISAAQQLQQYQYNEEHRVVGENSEEQQAATAAAAAAAAISTPAYLFKSHAVQFAHNLNYMDALRRVNWSGHGFKLLNISYKGSSGTSSTSPPTSAAAAVEQQASVDPVAVVLRCEQPESMAAIAAIVVHVYCNIATPTTQATQSSQDGSNASQQQQQQQQTGVSATPRLAPLHQRTLIRTAIDAALSDLKQQCPSVISDRRDRSLMKALPVVSTAVAGILNRAVGEGVLVEACQALRVREGGELPNTLHRKTRGSGYLCSAATAAAKGG
ncbi:hypothetical protein Ndes2526A_g05336 [Nannochloris sp. 'desiccata']